MLTLKPKQSITVGHFCTNNPTCGISSWHLPLTCSSVVDAKSEHRLTPLLFSSPVSVSFSLVAVWFREVYSCFFFLSVGWNKLWSCSDHRLVEANLLLFALTNSGRQGAEYIVTVHEINHEGTFTLIHHKVWWKLDIGVITDYQSGLLAASGCQVVFSH